MAQQYGPPWTRGFQPFFTGPHADQHMRVSDAERQAVADRLAEHFSAGRLDQAEFDERVGRAMSATTRGDLDGLFDDLPDTGAPAAAGQGSPQGSPPGFRRRRHRHPVLLAALVILVAVTAGHVIFPLLWVGFVVAVVLIATGAIGRPRYHQDR